MQATGQPRLALKKSGDDRFTVVGVDASISFTRDKEGAIDALILHQNGLDQRAPRQAK